MPLLAPAMEPLHTTQAGVLDIAYHQAGPSDGPPVLLMHGVPHDIHAQAEVLPPASTAQQGHRFTAARTHRVAPGVRPSARGR